MRAFLDGVVDVADGDIILDFVVEDRLEGAYDLDVFTESDLGVSQRAMVNMEKQIADGVMGEGLVLTTTPPMSNRIAFGGTLLAILRYN